MEDRRVTRISGAVLIRDDERVQASITGRGLGRHLRCLLRGRDAGGRHVPLRRR